MHSHVLAIWRTLQRSKVTASTVVKGNIANIELVNSLCDKGINVVIHFAAESHVDRSVLESDIFVNTKVIGTQVLLEVAKKYNVQLIIF